MSDPFLGEIRMAGFNFAPNGWALCSGQLMSISQNSALFSLLGTNFGGDGVTTFQLPNLQGRSPVGTGNATGLSPITIGEIAGTENVTLTMGNLPAHTHTAVVSGGGAVSGTISVPATTSSTGQGATPGPNTVLGSIAAGGRPGALYSTNPPDTTLAPFKVDLAGSTPSITNSMTGSNLPVAIRNPYLGVTFIIALNGIFPSRG